MIASILSYGLAVGAVYALIGVTYNVMFSASRVFSFTAGMLGMLGGVLGALFIGKWGLNPILGFVLVLACGAVLGLVTEILTVRPVLKSVWRQPPTSTGPLKRSSPNIALARRGPARAWTLKPAAC